MGCEGASFVALMQEGGSRAAESLGQPLDKSLAGHILPVLMVWSGPRRTCL